MPGEHDRTHRGQVVGVALVGFAIYGFVTASTNTATYVTSSAAIGHRRTQRDDRVPRDHRAQRAHVGGYDNTGRDLVCNAVGALVAAGVIERGRRSRAVAPAARPAA